jgi:hypothetical protein
VKPVAQYTYNGAGHLYTGGCNGRVSPTATYTTNHSYNLSSNRPPISAHRTTGSHRVRLTYFSKETSNNNGNTLTSGARTFAYDFETRPKSMNGGVITVVYDGACRLPAAVGPGMSYRPIPIFSMMPAV